MNAARRRFVHVFSTFGRGGPQIRAAQLMRQLGADVEHVVMAMDGDVTARQQLPEGVDVTFCEPPPRAGFAQTARQQRAWLRQQRPDLVLTYNWGAIETVAAAKKLRLPRVHHEDGFAPDEANRVLRRRNWMRWWLLRGSPLVVPSRVLLDHARRHWRLPATHLVNGVDLQRFAPASAEPAAFAVGSVGGLRPEKDYATLLRAVARAQQPANVRLVGSGPLEGELRALAVELGIARRVDFAGFTDDTAACYRTFSLFVLSSITEQMPIALLEAMASGLPCVATDVGDVRAILPPSGTRFVVPPSAADALAAAIDELAADEALRRAQGEANRARAEHFEADACLRRFCDLYRSAMRAG